MLDPLFDKFLKDQEALSGVLNPQVTRKNNESFRKKLTSWRKRKEVRKDLKTRTLRDRKKILDEFENRYMKELEPNTIV